MLKNAIEQHAKQNNWSEMALNRVLIKVLEQLVAEGAATRGTVIGKVIDTRPN